MHSESGKICKVSQRDKISTIFSAVCQPRVFTKLRIHVWNNLIETCDANVIPCHVKIIISSTLRNVSICSGNLANVNFKLRVSIHFPPRHKNMHLQVFNPLWLSPKAYAWERSRSSFRETQTLGFLRNPLSLRSVQIQIIHGRRGGSPSSVI